MQRGAGSGWGYTERGGRGELATGAIRRGGGGIGELATGAIRRGGSKEFDVEFDVSYIILLEKSEGVVQRSQFALTGN